MVMLGSTYGFSGAGWYSTSVFFVLMVRPKLLQAVENLSTLFCMCALVVQCTVDSITRVTKCIKQHRRKHDTEKGWAQDTSLLKPICDRKGEGAFSFVLHPCIHAVMKLSNDGDGFFGAAVFCHDSPQAISADHVKCPGKINISSRGQCSVPSLAVVLQQIPHVNSPTFLTEAAMTLW